MEDSGDNCNIHIINSSGNITEFVKILQDALKEARTKKVKSVALFMSTDGSHYTDYSGECGELISGLALLNQEILNDWTDEE